MFKSSSLWREHFFFRVSQQVSDVTRCALWPRHKVLPKHSSLSHLLSPGFCGLGISNRPTKVVLDRNSHSVLRKETNSCSIIWRFDREKAASGPKFFVSLSFLQICPVTGQLTSPGPVPVFYGRAQNPQNFINLSVK